MLRLEELLEAPTLLPLGRIRNLQHRRGKTEHRADIRPLWPDLDTLPLPHRELYFDAYPFMGAFPVKKFTSGRGCLHHCSYCYQPKYRTMCSDKGTYVRRKSPERVAQEVAAVMSAYPLSNAHFSDDLFITSVDWTRRLAETFPAQVGLPFTVNTSADFVTDENARLLAESGCQAVAIGIETYREDLRRKILNKDLDNETIRHAARVILKYGMRLVTFNMLASPDESVEDSLSTLRFNAEIGSYYARTGISFPIPETRMAKDALAAGKCVEGFGRDIMARDTGMDIGQVFFTTAKPNEGDFINLQQLFNLGVTYPAMIPLIERLVRLPRNPIFALFGFQNLFKEKSLFRFSLWQGLNYFKHVGWPQNRTTNFVSLV